MKKLLIIPFLIFTFFFAVHSPIYSATKPAVASSAKIKVATKLANGTLNVTFSNLTSARKITYQLMYKRSGIGEGVVGSVAFKGKGPVAKKLTLGTCSGKTCVYHKKISNIKLSITTKYSSGASTTTSYSIK